MSLLVGYTILVGLRIRIQWPSGSSQLFGCYWLLHDSLDTNMASSSAAQSHCCILDQANRTKVHDTSIVCPRPCSSSFREFPEVLLLRVHKSVSLASHYEMLKGWNHTQNRLATAPFTGAT